MSKVVRIKIEFYKYIKLKRIILMMVSFFIVLSIGLFLFNLLNQGNHISVGGTKDISSILEPDQTIASNNELSDVSDTQQVIPIEINKKSVSVMAYGAKGDGKTDDTSAIQKAIDDSSSKGLVLTFPKASVYYKVTGTIIIKENTDIMGEEAILFMPPQKEVTTLFYSLPSNIVSNVTISGLIIKSSNEIDGSGFYKGSKISNVQGIFLRGVSNLLIEHVKMENLYVGLKLGPTDSNEKNDNIMINDLQIISSRTPVLMSFTNNFVMRNSVLDAHGGKDQRLHSLYLDSANKNLLFDTVSFTNSPGGGIHIYNGYKERETSSDITFKNCIIENVKVGIYLYSGTSGISIDNIKMSKVEVAIQINNASDIKIENMNISNPVVKNNSSSLISVTDGKKITITKAVIDANELVSSIVHFIGSNEELLFSGWDVYNMNDIDLIQTKNSNINDLLISDSELIWNNITDQRINIIGPNLVISLRDNLFVNAGSEIDSLVRSSRNTKVLVEDNKYKGFTKLVSEEDSTVTQNNYNLDKEIYDVNKPSQ